MNTMNVLPKSNLGAYLVAWRNGAREIIELRCRIRPGQRHRLERYADPRGSA